MMADRGTGEAGLAIVPYQASLPGNPENPESAS